MGRKKREKKPEQKNYPSVAELLSSVDSEDVLLLDISGPPEEVQARFKTYIYKAREWCYKNGIRVDATRICGRKKHVFTTPIKKTLYTVVKYENDTITFIKQARYWWEKGYCTGGKAYELIPERDCRNYMECADKDHITLSFGGNHRYISNGNPGGSLTGVRYLRKAFTSILQGRERVDPKFVGLFVLYLGEAPTFEVIFEALYENIPNPNSYRLDFLVPYTNSLLRRWNRFSEYAMEYMHCLREGKELPELDEEIALPGLNSAQDILGSVKILQLDAYNHGIFLHEPAQHPDPDVWSATDTSDRRKDMNSMKKYGKGAATPEGSFAHVDESMFHMLNINGKVESLYDDQPPSSGLKLGRGHGLFSNKEANFSSSHAKRRMSTSRYANKILETPKDKLLHTNLVKRPHFSIINTSRNEDFLLENIRLTVQRNRLFGYPPKESKVCRFGGTTLKNASERFIESRMLTRRMLMLRPLMLGMHMVQTCPEWRATVPGGKGQGRNALQQFIPLSLCGPRQGFVERVTSLISKLRQCWRS